MNSCSWASLVAASALLLATTCTVQEGDEDDGQSSTKASTASSGGAGGAGGGGGSGACETRPTYTECADCFCEGDEVGCTAQLNIVGMYLFCGQTCAAACATYCSSYNLDDIDMACQGCEDAIDCQAVMLPPEHQADCMAASQSCQADTNCQPYIEKLMMCPAT
jgi:hypothetical protein